eukprot:TRINITY_DN6071_c0_g1_i1.p1 TRINITY_DN6071_c0_g1~~TRINITY_DN6071_c0_g1_i1.p1  ORF type:complete len:331 (-),score=60.63 TRINITY_DN6071_c0_g1_i1:31-1023(-)
MDARPYTNAVANRARGAGFENTEFYQGCNLEFLGIENIHHMRDSYEKVKRICRSHNANDSSWLSKLEATGWITHIHSILKGAVKISDYVRKGYSVVIHCSHGWDRTAQLCSLSQLILDPYYRSIKGFQELIEKDWVSFGHKCCDRSGHLTAVSALDPSGNPGPDREEEAPIFPQFIDCVYQMLIQQPSEFGFNEEYLCTILEHYFSCKYGTFLVNSEKQQKDYDLRKTTTSLWSMFNTEPIKSKYENPLYPPSKPKDYLNVTYSQDRLSFWSYLYNGAERIVSESTVKQVNNMIHSMRQQYEKQISKLQDDMKLMAKELEELKSTTTKKT